MNKFNFLLCFFLAFVFTSCFSTPSQNNEEDVLVYFYKNTAAEYTEYEIISLSSKSGGAFYSVDRDGALMMSEMGKYSVTDGAITIDAGKFKVAGAITDAKIVIDGKEFVRSFKKK